MAAFPFEILTEIMRASWPGLRLGLTCRALYSLIDDGLVGKFAQPVVEVDRSDRYTHCELPNGVLHGRASILVRYVGAPSAEIYDLRYSRGHLIDGYVDMDGTMVEIYYHKNMIVMNAPGYRQIAYGSIRVKCEIHVRQDGWDWSALPRKAKILENERPEEWYDRITSAQLWVHDPPAERAVLQLECSQRFVEKWPDVRGQTPVELS